MSGKKKQGKKSPVKTAAKQAARNAAHVAEKATQAAAKTTQQTERTMIQGKANFEKFGQDAAAAGKEHVEALTRSGTILAKGFEDFFKTYASLAQSAAERNAQAVKALLGSKTLNEFTETQNRVAQESLDGFLTGVTQLSELGVKLATETFEPINDQISKSMKKAGESAAA